MAVQGKMEKTCKWNLFCSCSPMSLQVISLLIVIFLKVGFASASGAGPQVKNPMKVNDLIGLRVFAGNPATPKGEIPDFHEVSAVVIATVDESQKPYLLLLIEGFLKTTPVFIVCKKNKGDPGFEILDVQVIPSNLYEFRLNLKKKGSPPVESLGGRFRLSESCSYERADQNRIIVGLVKPEKGKEDCAHDSRQVGLAWEMDPQNGLIRKASVRGLSCYYLTIDPCE